MLIIKKQNPGKVIRENLSIAGSFVRLDKKQRRGQGRQRLLFTSPRSSIVHSERSPGNLLNFIKKRYRPENGEIKPVFQKEFERKEKNSQRRFLSKSISWGRGWGLRSSLFPRPSLPSGYHHFLLFLGFSSSLSFSQNDPLKQTFLSLSDQQIWRK